MEARLHAGPSYAYGTWLPASMASDDADRREGRQDGGRAVVPRLVATPIPKNEAAFSLPEVLLATSGVLVRRGAGDGFRGVSTDSRSTAPGEIFVALRGERFDGHEHVRAAVERGAAAVVVSRDVEVPASVALVRVDDTLVALGDLASMHRARWARDGFSPRGRVVGVTGSAGKTTTRHAIAKLLGALGPAVHASTGNLNNAIGVPMTLFGLSPHHELAVIEMGMNQPAEIRRSAEIARPDAAVVTLVADAHTEGVGSIWGVLREKSDVFAFLGAEAVAVANADDELSRAALVRAGRARRILYGASSDAHVRLVHQRARGLDGTELSIEVRRGVGDVLEVSAVTPLLGRAGIYASLAAVAIAVGLDIPGAADAAAMAAAIQSLSGNEAGRLDARARPQDGAIIIDDAYNANPASMKASIQTAQEIAGSLDRKLVLVLGTMFELGARSDELHEDIGRAAAAAGARMLVAVGPSARAIERGATLAPSALGGSVVITEDADAASRALAGSIHADDVVLVKASNSLGLSRVAARLMEASPNR